MSSVVYLPLRKVSPTLQLELKTQVLRSEFWRDIQALGEMLTWRTYTTPLDLYSSIDIAARDLEHAPRSRHEVGDRHAMT